MFFLLNMTTDFQFWIQQKIRENQNLIRAYRILIYIYIYKDIVTLF